MEKCSVQKLNPGQCGLAIRGRVLSGKHLASRKLLSILILLGTRAKPMNNAAQHTRSKNSATSYRKLEFLKD
jgi:hypothetical protein